MPEAPTALRVCLDINVYIARQLAAQSGRSGGAASALVDIARDMNCEAGPVQLVMSLQMIGTLEDVLGRLKFQPQSISDFTAALVGLMKMGPEGFDPFLSPSAGGLAIKDTEDAGVLASCIAPRVHLLVTDNLDDFLFNDVERIVTPRGSPSGWKETPTLRGDLRTPRRRRHRDRASHRRPGMAADGSASHA